MNREKIHTLYLSTRQLHLLESIVKRYACDWKDAVSKEEMAQAEQVVQAIERAEARGE